MIFLILIIIFILFNCFRSSLRGIQLSLLDAFQLFISTMSGFLFSPLLVSKIMDTNLYFRLKLSLGSMINYNSVILHLDLSNEEKYIDNLKLPKNIYNIIINNNNPQTYAMLNVVELKDYIVATIMFILTRYIAFIFFAITTYVLYYYIRLMFMSKITFKDFGIWDKIIGGIIGVFKGLYFSCLMMITLLMYFSSIGFAQYRLLSENSFIVDFFENYYFLIEMFLIRNLY